MRQVPIDSKVDITVTEYDKDSSKRYIVEDISEIDRKEPEGKIRWINCEGRNKEFLHKLGETFQIHPIAIEDMEEIPQRKSYTTHSILN